jgi:hypothetical protein
VEAVSAESIAAYRAAVLSAFPRGFHIGVRHARNRPFRETDPETARSPRLPLRQPANPDER